MFDQKMCSANKLPLGLMDFSNIIEKNKIYFLKYNECHFLFSVSDR